MIKGPNTANDQQSRIKIPVLPDLLKAKGVRHLNMLRLANTEKKTSSTLIDKCKYFELNLDHFELL